MTIEVISGHRKTENHPTIPECIVSESTCGQIHFAWVSRVNHRINMNLVTGYIVFVFENGNANYVITWELQAVISF